MARTKKTPRRKQFLVKLLRQMRAPKRRKTAKQSIRKSQQCVSNTLKEQRCKKTYSSHTEMLDSFIATEQSAH